MSTSTKLLAEFPPVSTAEWEAVIQKDLKGADYAKRLLWQTEEGITVKPYYRAEDVQELELPVARSNNDWTVCEDDVPASVAAYRFQEAGGTTVQELGFAIAEAVDHIAASDSASDVSFSFAVGTNYFFEIAKFRAARLLWAKVLEGFGLPRSEARIHARTSRWDKTVYDPYVNLLRSTTEAMSAAIGGVDSMYVTPFDETYREPDEFSKRLARNTQIILKKEAYFDRVADPAAGSYYVEALTASVAAEAWKLFQQVEAKGGFAKAAEFINAELAKSQGAKEAAIASRRKTILGTNQYPNLKERMLPELKRPLEGVKRGAEVFEKIRMRTERGKAPKFLLAEMGDLKMRKARSGFVTNFFGCGGFEIITQVFEDVDAAAKAATEIGADAVVLCSSDDEYTTLAGPLCAKVGVPVIVAGFPKDSIEQLKKDGVAEFVHVKSNAAETLAAWQRKLGVKE